MTDHTFHPDPAPGPRTLPDLSGRSFLLLQGPQSGFFRELAKGLREAGALVEKVNFCGGDVLLWGMGHAFCYRGTRYEWLSWVGKIYRGRHITDICVYGDWRPMHWEAIRLADTLGIRIWVYEEGYLRNSYSTLEEFGVNGRSRLPKTAGGIRALSQQLGPNTTPVEHHENDIVDKVVQAIKHHAGNFFLWPFFRHYRTHRPSNIAFELIGILPRYFSRARRARRDAKRLREFHAKRAPYFFFPLQLNSDSQIQLYSPYVRMHEAIADVLTSFAKHAPKNTHLLIKNHPLDNGLIDYDTFVKAFSSELGIADRVTFVDFGNTGQMVGRSLGVVLVNSTVGLMALEALKPVYCLGRCVYNLPGLTQSMPADSLDVFWRRPVAPDPILYRDFKRVLGDRALIRGNFYTSASMDVAVADAVRRFARPAQGEARKLAMVLRSSEELEEAFARIGNDAPAQSRALVPLVPLIERQRRRAKRHKA